MNKIPPDYFGFGICGCKAKGSGAGGYQSDVWVDPVQDPAAEKAELDRLRKLPKTFDSMHAGGVIVARWAVRRLGFVQDRIDRRGPNDTAAVLYGGVSDSIWNARDAFEWFRQAAALAATPDQWQRLSDAMFPTIGDLLERWPGLMGKVMAIAEAEGVHLAETLFRTNIWRELKASFDGLLPRLPKPDDGLLGGLFGLFVAALAAGAAYLATRK